MDSSTPTTPISKPRLLKPKLEYPLDSLPNSPLPTPSSATKKTSISIHSPNSVSLHDLLLLSPSPCRKSKPRPKPIILDECVDAVSGLHSSGRRKGKSRANGVSPRNARRARRRLEKESADLVVPFEEDGRVRRKRQSRVKNVSGERLDLVVSVNNNLSPSSSRILDSEIVEDEGCGLGNGAWELISELVMWKNAAKSSLWFGLGTMIFGSSCFSKDVSFRY